MEQDAHLSFFETFERLPPNHENQLTRALLLVLRLSPVVHEAWLTRAAPGRRICTNCHRAFQHAATSRRVKAEKFRR